MSLVVFASVVVHGVAATPLTRPYGGPASSANRRAGERRAGGGGEEDYPAAEGYEGRGDCEPAAEDARDRGLAVR